MTIVQAAIEALKRHPKGLTIKQLYEEICHRNLYEFKAKSPIQALLPAVRRQCYGLEFPTAYPVKHFEIAIIDGVSYYSNAKNKSYIQDNSLPKNIQIDINALNNDVLPEELVIQNHCKHIEDIKRQLLDAILDDEKSKNERGAFFERLIVDLMIKLGYGRDNGFGKVTGCSHDKGIDGVIYEDQLGLNKITIQAKCEARSNSISRGVIQQFYGAMVSVQKGVFVTTAHFSKEAIKYAETLQDKTIKLIDGNELTELMLKCEIGLIKTKNISLYELDKNFFSP